MKLSHKFSRISRPRTALRGSVLVEFTLVFIPFIFLVFCILEVGRIMWTYHTLAGAVKRGTRFAIVHGARCAEASASCPVTVGAVMQRVRNGAVGLDVARLQVTLQTASRMIPCNPALTCLDNGAVWPAAPDNDVGRAITIAATYPAESILASWWPGQGRASYYLRANSREIIQF
jgi:hypothetical protein